MSASNSQSDDSEQVNFGYQKVSAAEKTERVGEVFRAVARRYDVMNDIMSLGSSPHIQAHGSAHVRGAQWWSGA